MKIVLPLLIAFLALLFYNNKKEKPVEKVEIPPTTSNANDYKNNLIASEKENYKTNTNTTSRIDTNNKELNRIIEINNIESL